jgi:Zn-dependent oligopeptidase
LRAKILAKGNSEPAEQVFRDFMGRDLDSEAVLVRDGLA